MKLKNRELIKPIEFKKYVLPNPPPSDKAETITLGINRFDQWKNEQFDLFEPSDNYIFNYSHISKSLDSFSTQENCFNSSLNHFVSIDNGVAELKQQIVELKEENNQLKQQLDELEKYLSTMRSPPELEPSITIKPINSDAEKHLNFKEKLQAEILNSFKINSLTSKNINPNIQQKYGDAQSNTRQVVTEIDQEILNRIIDDAGIDLKDDTNSTNNMNNSESKNIHEGYDQFNYAMKIIK